mgnify:CR=1 FL=1
MNTDIVGYSGTIILSFTLVPQVYKTFSDKKAEGLSYIYLSLQTIANLIFIYYGYLIKSLPIIICNSFVLICSSSLLFSKHKYKDYEPIGL